MPPFHPHLGPSNIMACILGIAFARKIRRYPSDSNGSLVFSTWAEINFLSFSHLIYVDISTYTSFRNEIKLLNIKAKELLPALLLT